MYDVVRHRRWLFVFALLAFALPGYSDNVTVSGNVTFASLDGSSLDHDGAANGTFTVNDGDLTVLGTINCNDDGPGSNSACAMQFAVSGNVVLAPGSAIYAENRSSGGNGGNITFNVGGSVLLQGTSGATPGAIISSAKTNDGNPAHGGDIAIVAGGTFTQAAGSIVSSAAKDSNAGAITITSSGATTVGGYILAGPTRAIASTIYTGAVFSGGGGHVVGGPITIKALTHSEPGLIVNSTAIIASQGTDQGANPVTLEGCGVQVKGLIASLAKKNAGPAVIIRSGTTLIIDSSTLAGVDGAFRGAIRASAIKENATGYHVDLFARNGITVIGPNPSSTFWSVQSNGGDSGNDDSGTVNVISTTDAVTASGNAFQATGNQNDDRGGHINVSAKSNVTLNGATLDAAGGSGGGHREGGDIAVRSYSGAVIWQNGVGDVRPVGSSAGVPVAQQGTISLTYCTTLSTSGTSFLTNGSAVGVFPTTAQSCSPAAPSLPAGNTLPDCNTPPIAVNDAYSVAEGGTLNVAAPGVLGNDTDPEGQPLTAILVSGPSHASSFTFNANGSFNYVHDGSETTSDSFTYKANDGSLDSNVATVNITISPVNDPPVANNDNYSVNEGGTLNVAAPGVKANDTDPDGPSGIVTLLSGPAHASSFTLNTDGSFIYVHDGSETTSDSFTYQLSDGSLNSSATVSITVNPVNDAPVANNDNYNVNEGGTLNVAAPGVLGNDTDVDSPTLTADLVSGPAHASSFILNADGSFSYVHDGSETTSDSLTYKANDGSLDSNVATVNISIAAVNDAPVANNDGPYNVNEGGTLNVASPGVLGNDTDVDSPTLTAVLVSGPTHASSFTLNPDGSFTYVHDGSETTSDSFTYKANDGSADSNVATVSITIAPVNDAPVAVNDAYNVNEGDTLTVSAPGVLGNDTDAENSSLNAILVSGPAHASSFTLNPDGSFTYVHDGGETTTDSFTYKANDGSLDSNVATVTITIAPVDDAPVANNDGPYSVNEGGTLSVAAPGVLGNDTDVDSPTFTAVLVSGPAHASSFTLNPDGSFTYVHNGSETTSDSFTYKANDGSLDSNVATVTITIAPVNDAPVANNDSYLVNEGGTLTVATPGVLGNDTDAENNALTAVLVTGPTHASSFTLNPDGSFVYVHDGSETTTDSFTYRANDGSALSNIATVTITINPVNDAPVANPDAYTVSFHQTLNVAAPGVLGNDTDAENNGLTAVLVTGPTQGTFALNPDGSFTYTHTGATLGTDSFTYQAQDSFGAFSNITTVTINIINQAPVANNDSYSGVGNTELRVGTGPAATPAVVVSGSVLANDTDSDGPVPLFVSAFSPGSVNGGTVSMNPNGSFNYLPPVGFVGTDSFNYTVSDSQATAMATVTITISERVWYVNFAAGGTQTGRSTEPFATLTQANAASFVNDYIYVAQGSYSSGIVLKNGQRLIGSGVALVVSPYTLVPATVRPVIGGVITLASGNVVSGLNVNVSSSVQGIFGSSVTGGTISQVGVTGGFEAVTLLTTAGTFNLTDVTLTPSGNGLAITGGTPTVNAANLDVVTTTGTGIIGNAGALNISAGSDGSTVSSTGGVPVDLTGMTLSVALRNISATGGTNGIKLTNTTGSFSVTGDGSLNANGSGGSISNVTSRPVYLLGAAGVVDLASMNMSLSSSALSGMLVDNSAGGTLTVNVRGCTVSGANAAAQVKALLQFEGAAAANVTANVQGSFFNNSSNYGFYATAAGTSIMNVTVNQSGFGTNVVATGAVNNPGTIITLPNVIGMAITNGNGAQVDYSVTNNTFWGSNGTAGAIYAVTFASAVNTASSHLIGSFTGNRIGQTGVVGSGCSDGCSGLGLLPGTNGTFKATVLNNDIRQVGGRGVDYANTVSGAVGSAVLKIKGNTLAEPDPVGSFRRAISVSTGNSGGSASNVCAEIGGATAAEQNVVSGVWQAGQFIRVTTTNTTGTLTLPGLTPTTGATTTQINAFITGNNVGVTANVTTTIGGAIVGGSPCP